MSNDEYKTISINITKELDEKLTNFAKAMNYSKSQLCQEILNNQLENYYNVWKLMRNPKELDKMIATFARTGQNTSELVKIKKAIANNPDLVNEADKLIETAKPKKK